MLTSSPAPTHQTEELPRGGVALPELDLLVLQAVVADVAGDGRVRGVGGGGGVQRGDRRHHHQEHAEYSRHAEASKLFWMNIVHVEQDLPPVPYSIRLNSIASNIII